MASFLLYSFVVFPVVHYLASPARSYGYQMRMGLGSAFLAAVFLAQLSLHQWRNLQAEGAAAVPGLGAGQEGGSSHSLNYYSLMQCDRRLFGDALFAPLPTILDAGQENGSINTTAATATAASASARSCVRASYKRLMLLTHPDKSASPTAAEDFRTVKRAHDVLLDDTARWVWELHGTEGLDMLLPSEGSRNSKSAKGKQGAKAKASGGGGGTADAAAKYAQFQRFALLQLLLFYGCSAGFAAFCTAGERDGSVLVTVCAGLAAVAALELELVFGASSCLVGAAFRERASGSLSAAAHAQANCFLQMQGQHAVWSKFWDALSAVVAAGFPHSTTALAVVQNLRNTTVHEWVTVYLRGMLLPVFLNGCRSIIPSMRGETGTSTAEGCSVEMVQQQLRRARTTDTFIQRASSAAAVSIVALASEGREEGKATKITGGASAGDAARGAGWWGAVRLDRLMLGLFLLHCAYRWATSSAG